MKTRTKKARDLRNNPTEAEKVLWTKIQYEQLGFKFRRQHPIDQFIVDFFCPEYGLIIEVDGGQHAENAADKERTAILEQKGYTVLRFWNNEVLGNMDGVIDTIQKILKTLPPMSPLPLKGGGMKGGRDDVSSSQPRKSVDMSVYREDFPIFNKDINWKPISYLDTASSAQKPQKVIDSMKSVMEEHYSNIHRGLYSFSQTNTELYENVRKKVAGLINAPSDQEIVFTRNTTEAINLVVYSWARNYLKKGDEVILSEMEHHANIVPWQILRDEIGITIKIIPVLDDGTLDLEEFERLLTEKTMMLSLVHISNSLGTINPIKRIISAAKDFYPDMKILIDGSQAVVHGAVDVQDLGCDFYVLTGHKLYGPAGVGVLWGKYEILEQMPPYQGGGDMIDTVTFDKTTFKDPPVRFEAGTPSFVDVIGLGVAIDYVQEIGATNIEAHEQDLLDYMMQVLGSVEGLKYYGTAQHKCGIVSFTADWAHHSDIAMILDQCGVAVRSGHHCCMPLMQRFDIDGTVRASLGLYSNKSDIDALGEGLLKAKSMLE